MDIEQLNALKIAVVEEQIVGLREQQRAYNANAQKRFDSMEHKIDELTAIMNRGKGAYAASLALAAALGAVLIQIASIVSSFFHSR